MGSRGFAGSGAGSGRWSLQTRKRRRLPSRCHWEHRHTHTLLGTTWEWEGFIAFNVTCERRTYQPSRNRRQHVQTCQHTHTHTQNKVKHWLYLSDQTMPSPLLGPTWKWNQVTHTHTRHTDTHTQTRPRSWKPTQETAVAALLSQRTRSRVCTSVEFYWHF